VSLATLGLALLVLVALSHIVLAPENLLPQNMAAEVLEDQYRLFEQDLERIAKAQLFPRTARKRNAHDAIVSYVEGGSTVCKDVLENQFFGSEDSKRKNSERKNRYAKIWPDRWMSLALETPNPERFLREAVSGQLPATCRPGWIRSLRAFDHWNFFEDESFLRDFKDVAQKGSIDKFGAWSASAYPKVLSELRQMVVKEAFRLMLMDQTRMGLKLMRHVATLLDSTRTLKGQVEAARLLEDERKLAVIMKMKDWPSISSEISQSYERVGWGWAQVLSKSVFQENFPERWQPYVSPEFGMCGGLTESPMGPGVISDFLGRGFPFEGNLYQNQRRATLENRQRLAVCGLSVLEPLLVKGDAWSSEAFGPKWLRYWTILNDSEQRVLSFLPNPSRLPFLRRIIGAYLVANGSPNYLKVYQQRNGSKVY